LNLKDEKTLPNWLANSFEGGLFWGTIYTVKIFLKFILLVYLCFSNMSSKNSRRIELRISSGCNMYLLCGFCGGVDIFYKPYIGQGPLGQLRACNLFQTDIQWGSRMCSHDSLCIHVPSEYTYDISGTRKEKLTYYEESRVAWVHCRSVSLCIGWYIRIPYFL